MYLGIDIGGTFTDLVLMDDAGHVTTTKALTTSGQLEDGPFEAIGLAARARARGLSTGQLLVRSVQTFAVPRAAAQSCAWRIALTLTLVSRLNTRPA
jgi:N-methylhydantoinase A/oxoprolinase/acetone carboxylase beta subunit